MAYGSPSPLLARQQDGSNAVLWSASGVEQGDPIGPLYFAIAFRPTLLAAQEAAPDTLAIACHDDLTVQGTVEQVVAMGRVVQSRHQCNKQKTLVHCTDPAKASHAAACLGATVATDGMVACGAPLGTPAYVEAYVRRRCKRTVELMQKLAGLPLAAQTRWAVLFQCLQHREAHLLRTTDWAHLEQPLMGVENASIHAMCRIIETQQLTDIQREQALIPHRHGGMGLRHYTADVADAARLASAAVAHAVLADGIDGGKPFRGDAAIQHQARLARLRKAWLAVQGISDSPTPADAWASDAGSKLRMTQLQSALSRAEADARWTATHDYLETLKHGPNPQSAETACADLARLLSCSGSLASAFLTACPGPVTGLTDHEFQVAVLLRLGEALLPVLESDEACPCGRVAASGTHSVICGQLWASSVLKHDVITVAWRRVLMRASLASSLEPHVGKLPGGIRVLSLRGSRQSPPAAPPADFTRPPAVPSASAPAAPCQQDPPPPPPPPSPPPPPPPPDPPADAAPVQPPPHLSQALQASDVPHTHHGTQAPAPASLTLTAATAPPPPRPTPRRATRPPPLTERQRPLPHPRCPDRSGLRSAATSWHSSPRAWRCWT
eukprot:jgi/Ulvmu1/8678/UM047_0016.1